MGFSTSLKFKEDILEFQCVGGYFKQWKCCFKNKLISQPDQVEGSIKSGEKCRRANRLSGETAAQGTNINLIVWFCGAIRIAG